MAIIRGTSANNTLNGTVGNDEIYGLAGNDILKGDRGNDLLDGGEGADELYGDDGNDKLYGGEGDDSLWGDGGDDFIYGGNGSDYTEGGDGNDYLIGGNDGEALYGGSGNDIIHGQAGGDTLGGGDGNDVIDGGEGQDDLLGGSGQDWLFGGNNDDNLEGDDGNDTLYGEQGNDKLAGGSGNDTLFGGDGNDLLDGLSDYSSSANQVDALYGEAGKDTFRASYRYDDNNPATTGTSDYALIKDFDPTQDLIQLYGAKTNYVLKSSPSGLPQGTAIYFNKPGDRPDELLAIVENKPGLKLNDSYFTTTVDDWFYASDGDDYFDGGEGNDHLDGGKGNDTLFGSNGNDYLAGGLGNDSLNGGNGNDVLIGVFPFNPLSQYYSGPSDSPPIVGLGEIDILTGGAGADSFWLGDALSGKYYSKWLYYDDNNTKTAGAKDYALIKDFNSSQDRIQLLGKAEDYLLQSTSGSLPTGTGIYVNKPGSEPDELIGIVQGSSSLNLTASYFVYTNPEPIS